MFVVWLVLLLGCLVVCSLLGCLVVCLVVCCLLGYLLFGKPEFAHQNLESWSLARSQNWAHNGDPIASDNLFSEEVPSKTLKSPVKP